MKKKLVILAILVAFVITAGDAFAWGRKGGCYGGPGQGMWGDFRHLDYLQSELGLSDKQVKQIFDIGTQYREKRFENRNNPDKLAVLRDEHRKSVEAVLTKDQLEKYNDIWKNNNRCGRGDWRD